VNEIQFEPGSAEAHAGLEEMFMLAPAFAMPSETELFVVVDAELLSCVLESAWAETNAPLAIIIAAAMAIFFNMQFLRGCGCR
jgi:hypothetical protein